SFWEIDRSALFLGFVHVQSLRYVDGAAHDAIASPESESRSTLDRFDLIPFNANRKRPLDRFHRDDQISTSMICDQNSFHSVEASTANADALTHFQKHMLRKREIAGYDGANGIDLLARNRDPLTLGAYQFNYTLGSQDANSLLDGWSDPNKSITSK